MSMLSQLASAIFGTSAQASGTAVATAPGEGTDLLSSIMGMLNHSQVGGISGLLQKFQSAGLGHLMEGWIGTGANPPVTTDQLHQAIGPDRINEIAQQLGIPPGDAANQLAKYLPEVIDKLTPNGVIPAQMPPS